MATLEILLLLAGPAPAREATLDSLVAQNGRDFTVALSGPPAAVAAGRERLARAGMAVRSEELGEPGEIEQWNRLCASSEAPWLKPLPAGTELRPGGVAGFLELGREFPQAGLLEAGWVLPSGEARSGGARGFRPPAELRERPWRGEAEPGPAAAYAFAKEAFLALGGWTPGLPLMAWRHFARAVAGRFGMATTPEPLCRLGEAPPPPGAGERLTAATLLAYHAWTEGRTFAWRETAGLLARETGAARDAW